MLLGIDIGNTNTVFALYGGQGDILYSWRCRTERVKTTDEYAAFLHPLLKAQSLDWGDVTQAIISSVVPEVNPYISRFCEGYLKLNPRFVDAQSAGIEIKLDNPAEVGADRIVNAVAVIKHYRTPAIVIDFGTATTFDVIDNSGAYAGGVIAPGINLSMAALQEAAAKLPAISIEKPPAVIGTNTVHAMQSGVFYGYISLIEGILSRICNELGTTPADILIIATGGLAPLFAGHINAIDEVDDQLTLKGLLCFS